jgi:hypothetical protein
MAGGTSVCGSVTGSVVVYWGFLPVVEYLGLFDLGLSVTLGLLGAPTHRHAHTYNHSPITSHYRYTAAATCSQALTSPYSLPSGFSMCTVYGALGGTPVLLGASEGAGCMLMLPRVVRGGCGSGWSYDVFLTRRRGQLNRTILFFHLLSH